MSVDLGSIPLGEEIDRDDIVLFSESNSRFLVEVPRGREAEFESAMPGGVFARVGVVEATPSVRLTGRDGTVALEADIETLRDAWTRPLDW